MKNGKTLTALAQEIEQQMQTKKDYVADTSRISLQAEPLSGRITLHGANHTLAVNDLAHDQIAGRVGIPSKYYDRMRKEQPQLLVQNVNTWFKAQPERRLIRTIGSTARAFLSDRYRPIDNYDVAEATLPFISEAGCRVESCELTDRRMYLKAVTPKVQAEIKKGDVVQAGIVISNSEVGCGSVKIEPMVFRLVCLNGMIAADHSLRKYHVGKALGDGAEEFYASETRHADNRAFLLKVRDVVKAALTFATFDAIVNKMRTATERKVTGDPIQVVELSANHFGLHDDEKAGVLRHLIDGGDLSQYGLLNAYTRQSQDVESYERATELERFGGELVELAGSTWRNWNEK